MRCRLLALWILPLALALPAAARDFAMDFGQPVSVQLFVGPERDQSVEMQIRPLYVDGDLKEFTTGEPHTISETQFVVRRVQRLTDRLSRGGAQPFLWQRAEWMLADRTRGRLFPLNLPDFDPFYSAASWSQDWVAYCGLSRDGDQVYAVVTKLGEKQPAVRKRLRAATGAAQPDGECAAPRWEQQVGKVTFRPVGAPEITLTIGAEPAQN